MVPAWLRRIYIGATTALIYKYLNGSSAFKARQWQRSSFLTFCQFAQWNMILLASVLCKMLSPLFSIVKRATFPLKVQWRRLLGSLGIYVCTLAKSLQSCLTLCDPVDCSPLGSSVHGILQARILEWVAISFSRGSSWLGDQTHISCISRWIILSLHHLRSSKIVYWATVINS